MAFSLNEEQIKKLKDLDKEMLERKKKQEQTSLTTGIPVDIAGFDVIKIGTLLGLIKNKEMFENNIKTKSLIQTLMGEDTEHLQSTCPPGYYRALITVSEKEKLEYQQEYVHKQSTFFVAFREHVIKTELENINKHVDVKFHNETLETFKTECIDLLDVLIEDLVETPEDNTLWNSITVITNSLLGVLTICEYKSLVTQNIYKILELLPDYEFKIMQHLSNIDRLLSLFNGVLRKCKTYQLQTTSQEQQRLCNELEIRNFTKNPQLKPFLFSDIIKEVCIPSLMYLPVEWIFQKCLIGPYRNNSIGFLHNPAQSDFYILTKINPDGGRMWLVDQSLMSFTKNTRVETMEYIIKTFKTLYIECFQTNNLMMPQNQKQKTKEVKIYLTKGCLQEAVFKMLLRNLAIVSDFNNFKNLLVAVLKNSSPIIPTENDFFNYIKSFYDLRQPSTPVFQDPDVVFQKKLESLFVDYNSSLQSLLMSFLNT